MRAIYVGWDGRDDVMEAFEPSDYYRSREAFKSDLEEYRRDFPTEEEMLFACYEAGCYDGSALVYFRRGGKLYENAAGHCSCNGLDGQRGPAEVTPEYMKNLKYTFDDPETQALFEKFRESL